MCQAVSQGLGIRMQSEETVASPALPHQPSSQPNRLHKHSLEPADQFSAEKEHRGWDGS